MPKFLEDKLKKEYGAKSDIPYKIMNKMGAMHGNKITAKGKAMEKKHQMHVHGGSMHDVITMDESGGTTIHTVDSAQTYCVREALGNHQDCALEPEFRNVINFEE